jgi:hypothetical protein
VLFQRKQGRHMITVQFKINKRRKVVDKCKIKNLHKKAFRGCRITSLPLSYGELENGEKKVGVI